MLLSLCFFAVLAVMPGPFFLRGNVYRQVPLYCFLEKKATSIPQSEDPETYEKIIAGNAQYLGRKIQEENGIKDEKLLARSGTEHSVTDRTAGAASGGQEVKDATENEASQKKDASKDETSVGLESEDGTSDGQKSKDGASEGLESEDGTSAGQEPKDGASEGLESKDRTSAGQESKDGSSNGQESKDGTSSQGSKTDTDAPAEKRNKSDVSGNEKSKDKTKDAKKKDKPVEDDITDNIKAAAAAIKPHPVVDLSPESLANYDYLLGQFFIVDPTTAVTADQLNAASFLGEDLTIKQDAQAPQILIYHSHSQETFIDSREGEPEDTVVGVGNYLTELLTETYGYNVIHVTETFDIIDGEIDRSQAYDYAREYIEQVLAENPTIEVVIDLHRDGVPEDRHLVTEINGKDTAQIMFYNGLSYTVSHGPVEYLPNPYIQDNLAFSFQLEYQAAQYYPDFYRGIYLAGLRYNLHLRPKALLLEAGAQTNTVQEVKNAMEPFADILNRVLSP